MGKTYRYDKETGEDFRDRKHSQRDNGDEEYDEDEELEDMREWRERDDD